MSKPLLSICIPTYNRATYLDACLGSLCRIRLEDRLNIEVVVSDNASNDNTCEIVRRRQKELRIRYFRNEINLGGELNIFAAATRASSEYVWVFGDDDEFCEESLAQVLPHLKSGADLLVLNYSVWSKDMGTLLKPRGLPWIAGETYRNADDVLARLGIHLGYISSLIVRKNILLTASPEDRAKYVPYGFPHMYSIYRGLPRECRVAYLPSPLFRRREYNCDVLMGEGARKRWTKYFIEGTALIFDELQSNGYSAAATSRAKLLTLTSYGLGNVLQGTDEIDRRALLIFMWKHYSKSWCFWIEWLPALVVPPSVIQTLYPLYRSIRHRPQIAD
jgi:abequosyltransferase